MELLWSRFFGLTLSGGCAVCLLMLLEPVCRRVCSPGWNYRRWWLPLALFCLPAASLPAPAGQSPTPALGDLLADRLLYPEAFPAPGAGVVLEGGMGLAAVCTVLWGAGCLLFLVWHGVAALRFCALLRRCPPVTDPALLALVQECKAELGYTRRLRLLHWEGAGSPLVFGLLRPVLALPSALPEGETLALALRHELVHLKRGDLWWKTAALLACALHWYNPLAYLMTAGLERDCELSCDAIVTASLDRVGRRRYGDMLLATLSRSVGSVSPGGISTFLCRKKYWMKRRLVMILNPSSPRRKLLPVLLAGALLCAGLLSACALSPPLTLSAAPVPPDPAAPPASSSSTSSGAAADLLALVSPVGEDGYFLTGMDAYEGHTGIDFGGAEGSPIYAVADGTVVYSDFSGMYGSHITIDHGDGIQTLYAHCSSLLAEVGDEVKAGEEIAAMGRSGAVTGTHLHLEYRVNGEYLDPAPLLGL